MEKRDIKKIKISNRIRKELGSLDSLKESIKENGLLHPIVIDKHDNLIAGLRRLKAMEELNYKIIPVTIINLENNIKGEIDENMERKNFTPSEIYEIDKLIENKQGKRTDKQLLSISDRSSKREISNKITGVSHDTRSKIRKIIESKDKELIEEMDKKGNIKEVIRKLLIKERKKNFKSQELPKELFDIIYADPPWKYDFAETENRTIENQYPTMDLEDIKKLKIPSANNSVLFLWATAPKIREALEVMKSWGFEYKSQVIWDKEIIGSGYWVRGQHEILLIGVKGKFSPPFEENRFSSVYREKRTQHSKKPEFYYKMIEIMFPYGRYLELFSRNKRDKWVMWGSE